MTNKKNNKQIKKKKAYRQNKFNNPIIYIYTFMAMMINKITLVLRLATAIIMTFMAFVSLSPFVILQIVLSLLIMFLGLVNNLNMEISTHIYNIQVNLITGLLNGISF